MFTPLNYSIFGRAVLSDAISLNVVDIRAYSKDKHQKCDDTPFGGGAGMVMTPQPIVDAIRDLDPNHKAKRVYMSPRGKKLTHLLAKEYGNMEELLILCGRYEGVDQRAIDLCIDDEVSIGDYVLTGGELPAMVFADCVSRFVKGVLGSEESALNESFSNNLLEHPHYTRPQVFEGLSVPEVLFSGHHKNIEDFRREESVKITLKNRPDLLKDNQLPNLLKDNKSK